MLKNKSTLQTVAIGLLAASAVSAYLVSGTPLLWEVLGALGLVALVAAIWVGKADLQKSLSRRATRYGLNSVLMSVIVFSIVVVLNMIATQHDLKFDLTKNKLHTLSDQTIKVLKGLTREVKLRVFISPTQMSEYNEVFDKYAQHSKHLVKEFVDVDKDPLAAQKNDVKQTGTILVESDTRTARVEGVNPQDARMEEKLTNAIIQVVKGDKKKIYFLTGHGEHLISDTTREGYSGVRDQLGAGRFNVAELNLVEKDKIPADAEILVIAGPKKDFIVGEITQVEEFLKKGGKVLLMLEPDSTKTIQPLLTKYGVAWNEKKAVVEHNRLQQLANGNPLTPIVSSYDQGQEITRGIRQMSIFAIATPVEKAAKLPEGVTVATLFATSGASQEATVEGNKLNLNEKTDRKGPLNLALAISGKAETATPVTEEKKDTPPGAPPEEKKAPEYRMVVVGDSDFASNSLRSFGVNSDLFQNMLSWLAKEEDLISIRPKPADESSFDITDQRMRIINFASIVFLPFTMFISGILVWLSRRKK